MSGHVQNMTNNEEIKRIATTTQVKTEAQISAQRQKTKFTPDATNTCAVTVTPYETQKKNARVGLTTP